MANEITKKEESGILPDYMQSFKGEGSEDISADMIQKSFLQISHGNEDGTELGDWFDSVTKENFGKEVEITICRISRTWRKFNDDFKLESTSSDGVNWDNGDELTDDEKWKNAFIDMYVLVNETPTMPYIVSFKSTSFKTGKKLATAVAKFTRGNSEPIFARKYTLYHEEAKRGSKSYANILYKLSSGFNDAAICEAASKFRKMVMDIEPDLSEMDMNEAMDIEKVDID